MQYRGTPIVCTMKVILVFYKNKEKMKLGPNVANYNNCKHQHSYDWFDARKNSIEGINNV